MKDTLSDRFEIEHLQSATQIVRMAGLSVLCDPWLTGGEYYGAWYHWPPFDERRIATLCYDYIYVSHIHPDHLSEATFRALPDRVPVLIHDFAAKFLRRKIESLGFEVLELGHGVPFEFGSGARLTIFAADNCNPALCGKFMGCAPVEKHFGSTQIDTLALFEHAGRRVLNTNDCPVDLAAATIRAQGLDRGNIDTLLVGYAGAGPYPQCFVFDDPAEQEEAARRKRGQFLDAAARYIELVRPDNYLPFAGTYVLGGRLGELNELRGVPTVAEAAADLESRGSVGGRGLALDQGDVLTVGGAVARHGVGDRPERADYLAEIAKRPLAYDDDIWEEHELWPLILKAWPRFRDKAAEIGFRSPTKIIIRTSEIAFSFDVSRQPEPVGPGGAREEHFVKITLDHNLLHRLMRGPRHAHWNNAEIGSHLSYERRPDVFERGLYHALCFFHA